MAPPVTAGAAGVVGDEERARDGGRARLGRRWLWAVAFVIGAAVLLRAVSVPDEVAPDGTTGHVDAPPDLLADRPIGLDGLTVAWEHPAGTDRGARESRQLVGVRSVTPTATVLALGSVLYDTEGRELVGRRPFGELDGDGGVLLGDGTSVERWDLSTGELVDRRRVEGVTDGESVSVRGVFDDGALLVSVFDAAGGSRTGVLDPAGEVSWVPGRLATGIVAVHGDRLAALDRPDGLRWIDLATGRAVASAPAGGRTSPLVEVGDELVYAVDDVLLAIDADGRQTRRDVKPASADDPLTGLVVLGAVGDRIVVAGRTPDAADRSVVVHVARPPWTEGADTDVAFVAVVDPRPATAAERVVRSGEPGIARRGDAAVAGEVVVLPDPDGGRIRAVALDGSTAWTARADPDSSLSAAAGVVAVSGLVDGGVEVRLLDATDGTRLWTGVVERVDTPALVVAAHDGTLAVETGGGGRTLLDARTGAVRRDLLPPGGRPLGVAPAPTGDGDALVVTESTTSGLVVAVGEHRYDVGGRDLERPRVHGLSDHVLVVERALPGMGDDQRVDLVQPDGGVVEVADVDGISSVRFGVLSGEAAVRRDGGIAVLEPTTGAPTATVAGAYGVGGAGVGRLVALSRLDWWLADARDGARVGPRRDWAVAQPAIGDGRVAVVGIDGITVIDAVDGTEVWRLDDPPSVPATVGFAGRHLLVGTLDGRVLSYDEEGRPTGSIVVGRSPVRALAWEDGTLLAAVDGVYRALRADGRGVPPDAVELP